MRLASVLLGLSLAPSPVGAAGEAAHRDGARETRASAPLRPAEPREAGHGAQRPDPGSSRRPEDPLPARHAALRVDVGQPTPRPGDVDAVRAAALQLHEEQRHAEAAALLERLAEESGRDDLLFDAGQARFAAGHRAHALRLWQTYAAGPGRTAADLALVTRRIADARALTTAITVIIHVPSDMSRVTLVARRLHDPIDDERPPLALTGLGREGGTRSAVVGLDPGVWRIEATIDAQLVARELIVGRAPQTVELAAPAAAQPEPEPPVAATLPRLARVRRSATLLALSAPALATGAALVVLRSRSFDRHVGSCAIGPDEPLCVETAILAHARFGAAGGGLVGAGLGLIAAGVTAATPVQRRVWVIEAIVGGAALTIGAAWLGAENLAYGRSVADDYLARVGPWYDRRVVATSLLGAGLGLALGAGVGLLPPSRRARAAAWTPILSPGGLGMAARF